MASWEDNRRAQLNLQVSLLAESEMTKVLQMLQGIGRQLGMSDAIDPELRDLSTETQIGRVAEAIAEHLPAGKPDES